MKLYADQIEDFKMATKKAAKKAAKRAVKRAAKVPNDQTYTHAINLTLRSPDDGVPRRCEIAKTVGGNFELRMLTFWDGDLKPPMVTLIYLTPPSYELLIATLIRFSHDLGAFKIKAQRRNAKPRD